MTFRVWKMVILHERRDEMCISRGPGDKKLHLQKSFSPLWCSGVCDGGKKRKKWAANCAGRESPHHSIFSWSVASQIVNCVTTAGLIMPPLSIALYRWIHFASFFAVWIYATCDPLKWILLSFNTFFLSFYCLRTKLAHSVIGIKLGRMENVKLKL